MLSIDIVFIVSRLSASHVFFSYELKACAIGCVSHSQVLTCLEPKSRKAAAAAGCALLAWNVRLASLTLSEMLRLAIVKLQPGKLSRAKTLAGHLTGFQPACHNLGKTLRTNSRMAPGSR